MSQFASVALLKKNPLFRNFVAASTISLFGTNVFDIAMPLYVLEKTHSVIALSAVSVALTLPFFLMAPLTGFIADHFDQRKVMLSSDIGQVIFLGFLLIYEATGTHQIWPILLTVFLAKTLMILFETVTTFQLIPALVREDELADANACYLSAYRLIQIFGPLSGGLLMGLLGVKSCIAVNIVSFSATLYFVYKMKNLSALIDGPGSQEKVSVPLSLKGIWHNFTTSIRYVWHSKLFRPFILLMFLWNLSSLNSNSPSITFYFTELMRFSPAQYGFIISLFGFLGIIGFLNAGSVYRHAHFRKAFVTAALGQAILASLAMIFIGQPIVLAILFSLSRVGSSILSMGTFLLRQTEVPRAISGGVNACLRMFFMSAGPISALLQGFLIHHFGIKTSFFFGVLCLWGSFGYARSVAHAYQGRKRLKDIDKGVGTNVAA